MKWSIVAIMVLTLASCTERKQEANQPNRQEITQTPAVEETPATLIKEGKDKLAEAKGRLAQLGKYDCCIKSPCNLCALADGDCDCYADLKKGEHVCVECYAGWQQGNGADPKISKDKVTTSVMKHEHHN